MTALPCLLQLRGLVRAGRYAEFKASQPAPKPVQEYGFSYWFGGDRNPDAGWKEQLGEEEERDLLSLALRVCVLICCKAPWHAQRMRH